VANFVAYKQLCTEALPSGVRDPGADRFRPDALREHPGADSITDQTKVRYMECTCDVRGLYMPLHGWIVPSAR